MVFILNLHSRDLGFELDTFLGKLLDFLQVLFDGLVFDAHEVVQSLFVFLKVLELLFNCTVLLQFFFLEQRDITLQVIGIQL